MSISFQMILGKSGLPIAHYILRDERARVQALIKTEEPSHQDLLLYLCPKQLRRRFMVSWALRRALANYSLALPHNPNNNPFFHTSLSRQSASQRRLERNCLGMGPILGENRLMSHHIVSILFNLSRTIEAGLRLLARTPPQRR